MGVPTHHHILINHPFNQFIRLFHPQTHYYKNHNHKSYIHYPQNNHTNLFLICPIFRIPLIDFDRFLIQILPTDLYLIISTL